MASPFISVCIPAYKNTTYLRRLLDSIAIQTFKEVEVIVTDDSPDDSVRSFVSAYESSLNLVYHRNDIALGTPENWNQGLRMAKGEWIKIMHDDDWFALPESLEHFAKAAREHPGAFIFSAYRNIFIGTGREEDVYPSAARMRMLKKEPYSLLSKNIIGPPSVTMHRNDGRLFYDKQTKWVVDIDFYIRRLSSEPLHYIPKPLINVGMSELQVTVDCVNNRKIQVPENLYLLKKVSTKKMKNLLVYDAWWRLIRNLEITRESEIREAGYNGEIPAPILAMVQTQKKIPRTLLTNGFFSKISMFVHYTLHKNNITS